MDTKNLEKTISDSVIIISSERDKIRKSLDIITLHKEKLENIHDEMDNFLNDLEEGITHIDSGIDEISGSV